MVRPTLSVVAGPGDPAPNEMTAPAFAPGDPRLEFDQWAFSASGAGTDWALRAVCSGDDPDALFVSGAAQRDAARICQACPVRLECLADALDNQIEYGVWGGMTERQRRAVLKKSPEVTSWRQLLEDARASATSVAAS